MLSAFTKSSTWNVSRVVNDFVNTAKKEPCQKETQSTRKVVRSVFFMYNLIYVVLIFPKGVDFNYRTETFPKITSGSLHLAES